MYHLSTTMYQTSPFEVLYLYYDTSNDGKPIVCTKPEFNATVLSAIIKFESCVWCAIPSYSSLDTKVFTIYRIKVIPFLCVCVCVTVDDIKQKIVQWTMTRWNNILHLVWGNGTWWFHVAVRGSPRFFGYDESSRTICVCEISHNWWENIHDEQ